MWVVAACQINELNEQMKIEQHYREATK